MLDVIRERVTLLETLVAIVVAGVFYLVRGEA
jgi:hypothetical protein